MDKSSNNSGGSSAGSHGTAGGGGIVGSTTAPLAYGIQFMPQPQAIPQQIPPLSQGNQDRAFSECPVTKHCRGCTLSGLVQSLYGVFTGTFWVLLSVFGSACVLFMTCCCVIINWWFSAHIDVCLAVLPTTHFAASELCLDDLMIVQGGQVIVAERLGDCLSNHTVIRYDLQLCMHCAHVVLHCCF